LRICCSSAAIEVSGTSTREPRDAGDQGFAIGPTVCLSC
jgi:hypothetical protein